MQSVVITGTSTGIGWGTAKVLLDRGFRVFGSVRRREDADRLSVEFGANFTPLLFDVTDEAQVPGPVKRPIWGKAEDVDISRYGNSPFLPALERIRKFMLQLGERGLPAEKIGELIHHALTAPNPRVRYQIAPDPMRHFLTAVLPKRMVDKIIAKRLGLLPKG